MPNLEKQDNVLVLVMPTSCPNTSLSPQMLARHAERDTNINRTLSITSRRNISRCGRGNRKKWYKPRKDIFTVVKYAKRNLKLNRSFTIINITGTRSNRKPSRKRRSRLINVWRADSDTAHTWPCKNIKKDAKLLKRSLIPIKKKFLILFKR